jgi:hypothetical protein
MIKRILLPAFCLFLLAACNNSSKDKENKNDTTTMMDDTTHHMPEPGATVPALPPVPEGAKVYFKNLKNDQSIASPFKLEMGADVIRVDTAGPVMEGGGHHHLFIDAEDSLAAGEIVPKDSTHIHFGKGQTEYELKLSPGKHKLTLQMADGLHRSYGSKMAATIHVNVKK